MLEDLPMPRMSEFDVRSPGHEGAGVVVAIGSNVKNWKVGDRGGVKPMWDICLNCEWCWDGQHETHCAGAISTGLMKTGEFFPPVNEWRSGTEKIQARINSTSRARRSTPRGFQITWTISLQVRSCAVVLPSIAA